MEAAVRAIVFGGGGLAELLWIGALSGGLAFAAEPTYHRIRQAFETSVSANPAWFFVVLTMAVHETLYYGLNGIFLLAGSKGWWERYQIERQPSQVPPRTLIVATLRKSTFSHWIMQPIALYYFFSLLASSGADPAAPLPPVSTAIVHLMLAIATNDAGFYWTHRLLHHPALYKRFHKQHHEYKGTIGFAAEYASPVESLLSNQLPMIVFPAAVGMHPLLWAVFLCYRLRRTYETHSGFAFEGGVLDWVPWLFHARSTRYHDYHHTKNCGNFGGPADSFWDLLCGTQSSWEEFNAAEAKKST